MAKRKRLKKSMDDIIRKDGRYPPEAFEFLHEGLARAVKGSRDEASKESKEPDKNHVTGEQMCMALRKLAIERWGMLARDVLERWNIHATIDFGNMVYLLIKNEFMRKTDEDSIEDFRDIFDFNETFDGADHFELTE